MSGRKPHHRDGRFFVRTPHGETPRAGEIRGRFGFYRAADGLWSIVHLESGFVFARAHSRSAVHAFIDEADKWSALWDAIVLDRPDGFSAVIIDVPDELKKLAIAAAEKHGCALTDGGPVP